MEMSGAKFFLAGIAMTAILAGCATTQQAMTPAAPTVIEGRHVTVELHDRTSFPIEKADRLYERVAGLLGVNLQSGDPRPTVVISAPEEIRASYEANAGQEYLDGFAPVAGYAGGKVLASGYHPDRLARMFTYHLAYHHLRLVPAEVDRLARRVENRITWEAANPFNTSF